MPNYQEAYRKMKKEFSAVHQKQVSVDSYDMCRYISGQVINSFVEHILESNPKKILESSVGNGRLFVPLAQKASQSTTLVGIDISKPMLDDLAIKLEGYNNILLHNTYMEDKAFFAHYIKDIDVVFSFATMHILSERWQEALDNLVDCLSPNGKVILGEEINAVFHGSENIYEDDDYRLKEIRQNFQNQIKQENLDNVTAFFHQFHQLRRGYGCPFERFNSQILHGDQSPAERYLRSKGFYQQTINGNELSWLKPHTFDEILYCMKEGTVTTLGTELPDKIREEMRKELGAFCIEKGYDLKKTMNIPSQIQLHIFEKNTSFSGR